MDAPATSRLARLEAPLILLPLVGVVVLTRLFTQMGLIGLINDDALYALYARSLVTGHGYVMLQWPDHPPAIRYPVGFPGLLALVIAGARTWAEQVQRLQWVPPFSAAAFAGVSYLYLRRRVPLGVAFAITLLIALHPITLYLGSNLLSDLPYAAIALGAVMALDKALKTPRATRWWVLAGLLAGVACLFRYAGAALVVGSLAVLVRDRRWRLALGYLASNAVVFGPWLLFRYFSGENYYLREAQSVAPGDLATLLHQVGTLSAFLLTNALPGVLLPGAFQVRTVATFAFGTLISAVVLLGAVSGFLRPREGETGLAPAIFVFTLGAAFVWGLGFLDHDDAFLGRMLLTVAPFVFLAFGRGCSELLVAARGLTLPRPVLPLALGVALLLTGRSVLDHWTDFKHTVADSPARAQYLNLFAYIRDHVPASAHLISWHSPMVNFYTDRYCWNFPDNLTPERLGALIATHDLDYLVGTPYLVNGSGQSLSLGRFSGTYDRSIKLINDFDHAYPGILEPVYLDPAGTFALLKFHRERARIAP